MAQRVKPCLDILFKFVDLLTVVIAVNVGLPGVSNYPGTNKKMPGTLIGVADVKYAPRISLNPHGIARRAG